MEIHYPKVYKFERNESDEMRSESIRKYYQEQKQKEKTKNKILLVLVIVGILIFLFLKFIKLI